MLTFAEAQAVGEALHDHVTKQLGSAPMEREDMGWGDMVQFVLRKASEAEAARVEGAEVEGVPV